MPQLEMFTLADIQACKPTTAAAPVPPRVEANAEAWEVLDLVAITLGAKKVKDSMPTAMGLIQDSHFFALSLQQVGAAYFIVLQCHSLHFRGLYQVQKNPVQAITQQLSHFHEALTSF